VDPQDNAIFISQGAIHDRTKEMLGESDHGLVLFRHLLDNQIKLIARARIRSTRFAIRKKMSDSILPPKAGRSFSPAGWARGCAFRSVSNRWTIGASRCRKRRWRRRSKRSSRQRYQSFEDRLERIDRSCHAIAALSRGAILIRGISFAELSGIWSQRNFRIAELSTRLRWLPRTRTAHPATVASRAPISGINMPDSTWPSGCRPRLLS
jgi:hypothetical protein